MDVIKAACGGNLNLQPTYAILANRLRSGEHEQAANGILAPEMNVGNRDKTTTGVTAEPNIRNG